MVAHSAKTPRCASGLPGTFSCVVPAGVAEPRASNTLGTTDSQFAGGDKTATSGGFLSGQAWLTMESCTGNSVADLHPFETG